MDGPSFQPCQPILSNFVRIQNNTTINPINTCCGGQIYVVLDREEDNYFIIVIILSISVETVPESLFGSQGNASRGVTCITPFIPHGLIRLIIISTVCITNKYQDLHYRTVPWYVFQFPP